MLTNYFLQEYPLRRIDQSKTIRFPVGETMQRIPQDVSATIQLDSGPVDGLQQDSRSARNQSSQDGLQELNELLTDLHNLLREYRNSERGQGLTAERIQKFSQIIADESLTGTQCGVCLEFIEVGRKMMRLDCDGHHVFCQDCVRK